MNVVKLPIKKRTIVGWRQLDRRKSELRSKQRAAQSLGVKPVGPAT